MEVVTTEELHEAIEHHLEHEALEEKIEELEEAQHEAEHEDIEHHIDHVEEAQQEPEPEEGAVWKTQLIASQMRTEAQLTELTSLVKSTLTSPTIAAEEAATIEIPEPEPESVAEEEVENKSKPTKRLGFGLRHRR